MPSARAPAFLAAALAIVGLAAMASRTDAGVATPTTTTVPAAPSTTVTVPTTTTAPVAVRRGGAEAGGIAKPEDEQWSVRQMITTTALCVIALAASGYAYGRIRSAPPRHPDLVHEPPEY